MPTGPKEPLEPRPDAILRLKEGDDYRLLFQRSPAAMLVVEPGTMRIRAVNEAATRALGYGQVELLGTSLRLLMDARSTETFAHLFEAGEVPILDARSAWVLKRRDGSLLPLQLAPAPVRFHGHNCALLYHAPEPVPSVREVGDKNANLTEFSYSALHDLKEPLHLIKGYLQLLRQRGAASLDPESHEYLEYAYTGTQRMQALVLNLLEYLRADVKGLQTEPVDLDAALKEALESLRFQVQEAEASVTHEPLPTLPADRTLLARLLQNLLANAIKFRGARPVKVHVSAVQRGPAWELCVKDNGIGIDPKDQARVLEPFQRVHSTDEYPGTGLGLSICRKIVEHHGGRLWLVSAPGEGTEVHFTLPAGV